MIKPVIIFLATLVILLTVPTGASDSTIQWNIQVSDLSGTLVTVSYDQLMAMPQTTVNAELRCFGDLIAEGDWVGVTLIDLLNTLGINSLSVQSIEFTASDSYEVSIPIDFALRTDVIIAYKINDILLPEVVRLVIPFSNGESWISGIVTMSLSSNSVLDPSPATSKLPSWDFADPGSYSQSLSIDENKEAVQDQKTIKPTPVPTDVIPIEPQAPLKNAIPTTPNATENQAVSSPVELVYVAVLGVMLLFFVMILMAFKRRKTSK